MGVSEGQWEWEGEGRGEREREAECLFGEWGSGGVGREGGGVLGLGRRGRGEFVFVAERTERRRRWEGDEDCFFSKGVEASSI